MIEHRAAGANGCAWQKISSPLPPAGDTMILARKGPGTHAQRALQLGARHFLLSRDRWRRGGLKCSVGSLTRSRVAELGCDLGG